MTRDNPYVGEVSEKTHHYGLRRPEFVLAGWTNPDGTVTVLASDTLSEVELAAVMGNRDDLAFGDEWRVCYRAELPVAGDLKCRMRRWAIATGVDFSDAASAAMKHCARMREEEQRNEKAAARALSAPLTEIDTPEPKG